jgi:hypothetical protein
MRYSIMLDVTHIAIPFDQDNVAWAVRVPPNYSPQDTLSALALPFYRGIIVLHGGAGGMEPDRIEEVRRFLVTSLAPFAEQHRLLLVDGGTRAGAMQAMGDARHQIGGTYPLVGVCPSDLVAYPGGPPPGDPRCPLDAHHSHFILVEGSRFGVESALLVGLLRAAERPGFALIINGGKIVNHEAQAHAGQGNMLVTVQGTGRAADALADPTSDLRAALPPGTRLQVVDVHAPEAFTALLEQELGQHAP